VIDVDLTKVPASVNEIVFVASIYQAAQKGQSLKDLDNAHIRIVNKAGDVELAKYTLSGLDVAGASFTLGKLVRNGTDWTFTAIGEAEAGELGALATRYGLQVAA